MLSTIATTLGVAGGTADLMLERAADRCFGGADAPRRRQSTANTSASLVAATIAVTPRRTDGHDPVHVAASARLRRRAADPARTAATDHGSRRQPLAGRRAVPPTLHDRPPGRAVDRVRRAHRAIYELDGLPLAIELAAARCAVIDPDELAVGLGDRLRCLRRRDGVARHRTLEAVIEWSYGLLDDDAQRQLRTLSAFHGPFDLAAAEAVSGRPALDDIAELVERSLVRRTGGGLMLLDSVRRFADARCRAAGEHGELAARHAQWVVTLAATPVDDPDADTVAVGGSHISSHAAATCASASRR